MEKAPLPGVILVAYVSLILPMLFPDSFPVEASALRAITAWREIIQEGCRWLVSANIPPPKGPLRRRRKRKMRKSKRRVRLTRNEIQFPAISFFS
jgi:hypothetical protein